MEPVDRATTDRIEQEVKGRFPEGALSRVEVLQYGDDPSVEPGEVAVRLTISSAAPPDSGEEPLDTFKSTHKVALRELRRDIGERFPAARRLEFVSDAEPQNRFMMRLEADEPAELTPVMARLGPMDLETLDTLITAGIAANRAQAVRWALARIRERPAYAQLRERAREIEDLRSQF
jgi:hypothetical protein